MEKPKGKIGRPFSDGPLRTPKSFALHPAANDVIEEWRRRYTPTEFASHKGRPMSRSEAMNQILMFAKRSMAEEDVVARRAKRRKRV